MKYAHSLITASAQWRVDCDDSGIAMFLTLLSMPSGIDQHSMTSVDFNAKLKKNLVDKKNVSSSESKEKNASMISSQGGRSGLRVSTSVDDMVYFS